MHSRHELMGKRVELERIHKKEKIVADAVSARVVKLLSTGSYEDIDAEELILAADILAKGIEHIQEVARQIARINSEPGSS